MGWGEAIGAGVQGVVTRVHGRKARHFAVRQQEDQQRHDSTLIQRRVADAQAAGIHPLFALGAMPDSGGGGAVDYGDSGAAAFGEMGRQLANIPAERAAEERQARIDTREDAESAARIDVLKSEAKRNDSVTQLNAQSTLARAAQLQNQLRPTPVIAPRGQVNTPGVDAPSKNVGQVERFGTVGGYIDAQKQFADAEEAERRWGDVAQEIFGLMNLITDLHGTYVRKVEDVTNPKTPIRSMEDWDRFQRGK